MQNEKVDCAAARLFIGISIRAETVVTWDTHGQGFCWMWGRARGWGQTQLTLETRNLLEKTEQARSRCRKCSRRLTCCVLGESLSRVNASKVEQQLISLVPSDTWFQLRITGTCHRWLVNWKLQFSVSSPFLILCLETGDSAYSLPRLLTAESEGGDSLFEDRRWLRQESGAVSVSSGLRGSLWPGLTPGPGWELPRVPSQANICLYGTNATTSLHRPDWHGGMSLVSWFSRNEFASKR